MYFQQLNLIHLFIMVFASEHGYYRNKEKRTLAIDDHVRFM